MRRLLGLAIGLALFTGTLAVADDPPKSPAEELKQLQKDRRRRSEESGGALRRRTMTR